MLTQDYLSLKEKIVEAGYACDIEWAENVKPCDNADDFFAEYMWVVLNSGMKNQVAHKISEKIWRSFRFGGQAINVFGHEGKAKAIDYMRENRVIFFASYLHAADKITFLKSLPWIGEITKWHLAKNLGHDCCKPDRHLTRISKQYSTTPEGLCKRLSEETGDRIALVDLVIWRAANLGLI